MANERIRLALVGCGGMAGTHLTGYERLRARGIRTFEIAAVCDPATERAERFAEMIAGWAEPPAVYSELHDMLRRERLNAADIATPHFLHHSTAIACMEAGLHVLVEKPLGVTIKAARAMIEAAQRTGRTLATAEQVRRWLGPRSLRWAVHDAGLIGRPRFFFAQHTRGSRADPDARVGEHPFTWRQDKFTGGGGIIFDVGVHYADLLLYLYGEVERVYASTGNVAQRPLPTPEGGARVATVEDTAIAHLTFRSGVTGTWQWSNACPGRPLSYNIYYGSHGSLYGEGNYPRKYELQYWNGDVTAFPDLAARYLESLDAKERERLFPTALFPDSASILGDHGVMLEVHDFLEAVRTGRPPELDGEDGLRAQAVVTALFESSASGEAVKVADVCEGRVEEYQREINARWGL